MNPHLSIMIVDDDPTLLKIMHHQLSFLGIRHIKSIEDSKLALKMITDGYKPDYLFCDMRMPHLDGPSFLRALAEQNFPGKIVLMSGEDERILSTVKELATSQFLNVIDSFKKPVSQRDLKLLFVEAMPKPTEPERKKDDYALRPLSRHDLILGLSNQSLTPFYQPKLNLKQMRVSGLEVLSRWRTVQGTFLAPFFFIPVAEEHNLIDLLTLNLLEQVFTDIHKLREKWPEFLYAINFSVETLENRSLPELLEQTLRKNDIPPESIVIEVTESRIARHRTNMLEVLTRLHLLGFSLSIDDFGTGYSSLDRLKELPFTELKIDRGFVSDAMKNEHGLAILRSSVQLARDFQMSIVAEGVENLETYNLVKTEDCDAVQGYFVAKPMSLNQLLDWLTRNSAPVKLAQ